MVAERFVGMGVDAEALVSFVVILMVCFSVVVAGTFNAEMVVCLDGEVASTAGRFQYALCEGDACRNLVFIHLADGCLVVFLNVSGGLSRFVGLAEEREGEKS